MSKTPPKKRYKPSPIIGGMFAFGALAVVLSLSLFSMDMALSAIGVLGLSFMVLYDRIDRSHWEKAVDFKIKSLLKGQKDLRRHMKDNKEEAPVLLTDEEPQVNTQDRPKERSPQSFSAMLKTLPPLQDNERPARHIAPKMIRPKPSQDLIDESDDFSDSVVKELLRQSLKKNSVDAFLQPIVHLDKQTVFGFEVFSRLRANKRLCVPAARYVEIADADGTLVNVDALLLMQCLETLRSTEIKAPHSAIMRNAGSEPLFFMNVTIKTLKDAAFMGKLLAFVSKNRDLAARLVFEIPQSDYTDMPIPVLEIVRGLGKLGVRFSIDHVTSLMFDIKDLQRFHVRFIKIGAPFLKGLMDDKAQWLRFQGLRRQMDANGVAVIAERVENEEMLDSLSTLALRYGQGYLFGRPALPAVYDIDDDTRLRA